MQSKIDSILQVFMVVGDLDASIKAYETQFGIGPWQEQDLSDDAVPSKWVNEQPCSYQVRIATCTALNVGLSLVQPLDDKSDFSRFLRENGPGIYHLLAQPAEGYDSMLSHARDCGLPVLHRGITANGIEYAHIDAQDELGLRFEMFRLPS